MAKSKHIAAHHGLSRYYGRTQAARAAHPECRFLSNEQEGGIEGWAEMRDTLGFPPNTKT